MSLLAEMKRRKVFRVGAAYAVAAWALAQIADLVLANTSAPGWVMQVILLVLALGFPVALILAWAYELTPDGVRRTETADDGKATRGLTTGDAVLIVLMLAVIAIAGYQVAMMPAESVTMTANGVEFAAGDRNAKADAEPEDGSTSIAVLAFENMSPDPDNAFFAEGISEEILNVLASVRDLRVASRTSAFSFAGTQTPIPEIAQRLGVVHVLEGSVRKAGNRVRITAQLIDARTDQHLWSNAYDRDLTDIFAVQEEIAQAITIALKDQLGIREVRVQAPTDNLEAYERLLRGRQLFHQRGATIDQAIADLERAVELDPDYGLAWAVLAAAHYVAPGYPTELTLTQAMDGAERALDRALAINPEQPLALAVRGQIQTNEGKWVQGLETLDRASVLAAQETTPLLWSALNLLGAGYVHEARAAIDRAWAADPLVGVTNGFRGIINLALGEGEVDRHIEFAARNGWEYGYFVLAGERIAAGRFEEAAEALSAYQRHAHASSRFPDALQEGMIEALRAGRRPELSDDMFEDSQSQSMFHLLLGNAETFYTMLFEQFDEPGQDNGPTWLRQVWQYRHYRPTWLRQVWQPSTDKMREHPLFFEFARRRGLVELWDQRGYPPGCRPADGPDGRHLDCPEFPQ
jgi:adenylate cyclase